jgi:excisionase family DNA binding protein
MNQKGIDDVVSTYVSQKDAADFLNCSERTILRYRKRGVLPFVKIKNKVCFKVEDVSKLHITMQNTTINAKIVQRLEFAEQEIRALKNRISVIESINGLILDEITELTDEEISITRDCFNTIISAKEMRWDDLETWARDVIRISNALYKKIGVDTAKQCIEKIIALLGFYKRKNARVLETKLKLRLYSF